MIDRKALYFTQLTSTLLILLFAAGCSHWRTLPEITPPVVNLTYISPGDKSLTSQSFNIGLRLQNPNGIPLPLKGMHYSIEINGQSFASGVLNQPIHISAFSEHEVEIPVSINLINSIRIISQLLTNESEDLNYRLAGTVSIDVPGIPPVSIEEAGTFKLKQ